MPIIKADRRRAARALKAVDWTALDALSDADIDRQIAANPDAAPVASARALKAAAVVTPEEPDVHAIRARLGLSQAKFAAAFGVSIGTVRNWEQRRARPYGSARVLLRVIELHPKAVLDALRG
ncbi:MAG: XRE family transcription factor [Proteobacteria bacterium]|nr:MAG: XRE family transcription factor [Pseudomonadota bacterium]